MNLSGTKGSSIILVFAAALALAALAAAWPEAALAQCPLCRSALQNDQTARTMNFAIIVLLIPPVSIFCAIFAVVYKKARGDEEDRNREP
jgi:heme/copper-type cytochrome/quinol oxidase subunit 2